MAKTKKAPEPIPGFHAVEASRQWRTQTGKRLAAMTPQQRRAYLSQLTADFFSKKAKPHAA